MFVIETGSQTKKTMTYSDSDGGENLHTDSKLQQLQ